MFFWLELKTFIIMSMFYQFSNSWNPIHNPLEVNEMAKIMQVPCSHTFAHFGLGLLFIVWPFWFQVKEALILHHTMLFKTTRDWASNFQSNAFRLNWKTRPSRPTSVLNLTYALMGASPCSHLSKSFEIYREEWRHVWQVSSSVAGFTC